jgi:hypothetical protein
MRCCDRPCVRESGAPRRCSDPITSLAVQSSAARSRARRVRVAKFFNSVAAWRDAIGSDSPRGARWRAGAIVPDIAAEALDAPPARDQNGIGRCARPPQGPSGSSPVRGAGPSAPAFVSTAGAAGLTECAQRMEARQGRDASRVDAQHDSLVPRSGMRPTTRRHHSSPSAASPSSPRANMRKLTRAAVGQHLIVTGARAGGERPCGAHAWHQHRVFDADACAVRAIPRNVVIASMVLIAPKRWACLSTS